MSAHSETLPGLKASGLRDSMEEHGWVQVRGIFSRREVETFRTQARALLRSDGAGDILADPSLGRLLYDARVVDVAREILGATPVYFGDGNVMGGLAGGTMEWHKDNPDRNDPAGPDWRDPYTIIRMGIYLQDHARHSGGLGIRDRSHKTSDLRVGRPIAVEIEVGDLVVWYLRTTHAGFAARLRLARRQFFPIRLLKRVVGANYRLPPIFQPLAYPSPDDRLALFFSFGKRDAHLARYVAYLKTRAYAVKAWQTARYSKEIMETAVAAGLDVMNIGPEVADLDAGEDRGHRPLPY